MISIDDFLLFSDRTLAGMRDAVARLDDSNVNTLPPLPDPNSAFQLVTHALAAAAWWTQHIVLGEPSDRDRDSEFTSRGTTAELFAAIDDAQDALHARGPALAAATELANEAKTQTPLGTPWTVGAAMIHTYEELAQHLGHLQITVDLVASPG